MKGVRLCALLLCACVFSSAVSAGSYLRIASWNTLHAGWSGQTDWNGYAAQMWNDFGTSSSSPNGLDLIFAQEVMYDTAAASIRSALNSVTGYNWNYSVTHAIGRSSYRERYAVFYRTDRVQLLSAYVWNDVGDKFSREPQIVKVRHIQTGEDYTFINWHTVFGTASERRAEINEIRNVFNSIQNSSGSDQDVILLGDHNRSATSNYWDYFNTLSPAVTYQVNVDTSINSSGDYANPYDHFWYQPSYVSEFSNAGRDYIANTYNFRHTLSDHAPIWMRLYSNSNTD